MKANANQKPFSTHTKKILLMFLTRQKMKSRREKTDSMIVAEVLGGIPKVVGEQASSFQSVRSARTQLCRPRQPTTS